MCFNRFASRRSLALMVALFIAIPSGWAEAPFRFEGTPGQLPKHTLPSAYRIELRPDAAAATFAARAEIDINVARVTPSITLNAVDLEFRSVELAERPGDRAVVTLDPKRETATFTFAQSSLWQASPAPICS